MAHQYAERQREHKPRAVPAEDADGAHAEVLEQRAEAQQILVRMKEEHPDLSDRRQHDVVLQLYRDKLPDYQDEQRRGERQQNPVKKKFHRSLRKTAARCEPRGGE